MKTEVTKLTTIYFSATATTRKCVDEVAEGFGKELSKAINLADNFEVERPYFTENDHTRRLLGYLSTRMQMNLTANSVEYAFPSVLWELSLRTDLLQQTTMSAFHVVDASTYVQTTPDTIRESPIALSEPYSKQLSQSANLPTGQWLNPTDNTFQSEG